MMIISSLSCALAGDIYLRYMHMHACDLRYCGHAGRKLQQQQQQTAASTLQCAWAGRR